MSEQTNEKDIERIEKRFKERPILPQEITKDEYDKVVSFLITTGFIKNVFDSSGETIEKPTGKVPMNSREAVTGFVGWLTSRKKVSEFGSSKDAAEPAELAADFCDHNNLPPIRQDLWVDGVEFSHPPETEDTD